jgi:hypothetical protein
MRAACAALAAGSWLMVFTPVGAHEPAAAANPHLVFVNRFLDRDQDRVRDYRAFRRLEATNEKFHKQGWIAVWTELTPAGLRYDIVESGGSDYIRSKVLEAALKNEQRLVANGDLARADFTRANYEFSGSESTREGLIKVVLKPRRADQVLVAGAMFLSAVSGDLIRVEGALARSPSFWTSRVEVVREYQRVAGVRVPVRVESTAQVKIAGASRFVMTYDYQRINGQIVGAPGTVATRGRR